METIESEYDVIIVGSGAGSVPCALKTMAEGKTAVIFEKLPVFGGTTSFSGGVLWVPNNPLMKEAGVEDSFDQAKLYLSSVVDYVGPSVTAERTRTFLNAGPAMVDFLRAKGMRFRRPYHDWPDYYDDAPGGSPQGRSLLADPFDIRQLGDWRHKLSIYQPLANMPLSAEEFTTLFTMRKTLAGKLKALKFAALMARDKLLGRQTIANGAAIQGRLLQIALRETIPVFLDTPTEGLWLEDGKVVGVKVRHAGQIVSVRARRGVVINAGGYGHAIAFREEHGRGRETAIRSRANPGDTGDILKEMMSLGAATENLDAAWWVITSQNVDGSWPEGAVLPNGDIVSFMHHLDLSLPHSIMVDQDGQRFCDEAGAYMEIGERMIKREQATGRGIPAWMVFDKRHRDWYPWGAMPPGKTPQSWLDSGYMKKAETLDDLAAQCGIDPQGLKAQVERFNGYCREGRDPEFNRGGRVFDRAHGDPTVKPNPSLGGIEQGPFYAVAMYPADVGTAGGVVTDAYARVMREDASVIEGLYAIGNAAASPFGRCYPGAGATIGPSMVFGFVAAMHAVGAGQLNEIVGGPV